MPRIFVSLAVSQLLLLLGSAAAGLFAVALGPDRHVLLAVLTLLLSCLIQVVCFTYLTVTGKMIVQAVHLGRMEMEPIERSKSLKKAWMRCLGMLIVLMVTVIATGAEVFRSGEGHTWHLLATCATLIAHFAVLWLEFGIIGRNAALVTETLAAYQRRRSDRDSPLVAQSRVNG